MVGEKTKVGLDSNVHCFFCNDRTYFLSRFVFCFGSAIREPSYLALCLQPPAKKKKNLKFPAVSTVL